MKRKVILDTETTGLKPEDGHRIVEIGAVEIIDNQLTGKTYYTLLNPERDIPYEVVKIHNITNEKVKHSPFFRDISDNFLNFISGSELLIHNASFDIKFLNYELDRLNKGKIWDYVSNATCTLQLDKRLFEKEKSHTLDSICKRFNIDLSQREANGHGALLDAQLLAEVYLKINELYPAETIEADFEQINWTRPEIKRYNNLSLKKVKNSSEEENNHLNFLKTLEAKEKIQAVFLNNALKNSIA